MRRLVLAPLAVVIAIAVALLFPLLALLAWMFGLAGPQGRRRMRALRVLRFALAWLTAEAAALAACLGLWLASGFGGRLRTEPYQQRHYAVMRWFLDWVYDAAHDSLGLRLQVHEPEAGAEDQQSRPARPVIVLSRHAGPGDSLLLVRQLLSVYNRRPRVVLKASLQLDPGVDVVTNRLPNVFVQHRKVGERLSVEQIGRLAGALDPAGALVIFPEGGNWTPGRWRRAIRRLEQAGRADLAAMAEQMPNVLAPRASGALAAITACRDADVIFVAHTGLDQFASVGDVWRSLPLSQVIRARWWRVPVEEVPRDADREAQVQWLFSWWQRIDAWITENRSVAAAGAAAPAQPAAADESTDLDQSEAQPT
jgi:hypothetical protein